MSAVGSGLPLCLAGIDISHQARSVRQSRNGSTTADEDASPTLGECRGEDHIDSLDVDLDTETRKNFRVELAKEMAGLDRRREALKAQQRTRLFEQLRRVRKVMESRGKECLDHRLQSHGARAA